MCAVPCAAPLLILCISPPLLCASAVTLSHLLSPCCVHPLFLPSTPLCMFAIYLSPPPAENIHCFSPSPSTCIHPASSSATAVHMSLFSAAPTGIHTHLPLPAFPHALSSYFSSPPSCAPYPCSSLYYSPFHLFDILVPSVSLSTPLFSQAPLCTISLQFSLICSHKLILQEKCSCLQGCASPHCNPFSAVSNLR